MSESEKVPRILFFPLISSPQLQNSTKISSQVTTNHITLLSKTLSKTVSLFFSLSNDIETSPLSNIDKCLVSLRAAQSNSLAPDHSEYFLRTALPKFIQNILQRGYFDIVRKLKVIATFPMTLNLK